VTVTGREDVGSLRRLLPEPCQPAGTRGRFEHEVLDEAVFGFLAFLRGRRRDEGFPALLDQISSRFDPGEDEALELGNEELRAFRGKRR
jgi:hypothetical protein